MKKKHKVEEPAASYGTVTPAAPAQPGGSTAKADETQPMRYATAAQVQQAADKVLTERHDLLRRLAQ